MSAADPLLETNNKKKKKKRKGKKDREGEAAEEEHPNPNFTTLTQYRSIVNMSISKGSELVRSPPSPRSTNV